MFGIRELGGGRPLKRTDFLLTFETRKSRNSLNLPVANHSKALEHHVRNDG